MNDCKVSILMPVRDAEAFISECIESIINQGHENWELLVVNDHSKDKSFEILEDFVKRDERIKPFTNSGNGIVDALSMAYSNSIGDLIHRMDADDVMPKRKLSALINLLDGRKRVVATGKVNYISDSMVSEGYRVYQKWINDINDYKSEVYRECTIASPNWLVHRSCFEDDIEISSLNYPEDYDLVLKWNDLGYVIEKVDEITHLWREHPQRTSRNSEIYQQESFFRLKLQYFVKNELLKDEVLQVIGVGKKGKLVVRILSEIGIDLACFDVNLGRVDSNEFIQDVQQLNPNIKAVLTNWPKNASSQKKILEFMSEKGFVKSLNYWIL